MGPKERPFCIESMVEAFGFFYVKEETGVLNYFDVFLGSNL